MSDDEFGGFDVLRADETGDWIRAPDGMILRSPMLAGGAPGRYEVVCGRTLEDGRLCGRAPHAGDCDPEGGRTMDGRSPSEQIASVIAALDALDAGARLAFRAGALLQPSGFADTRGLLDAARRRAEWAESEAAKARERLAAEQCDRDRIGTPEGGRL